jgi:hypothetical protein
MNKDVFLLGIGLAVVALAFAVTDRALRTPRDVWRWESAQRIREGMTRADMVRALGPPGNSRKWPLDRHREALHLIEVSSTMLLHVHSKMAVETWEFDGGTLVVGFLGGVNGPVTWAQLVPDPPNPAPAFEHLRAWLGW